MHAIRYIIVCLQNILYIQVCSEGKDLLIADALSRSHTTNHTRSKSEEEIETTGLVIED